MDCIKLYFDKLFSIGRILYVDFPKIKLIMCKIEKISQNNAIRKMGDFRVNTIYSREFPVIQRECNA